MRLLVIETDNAALDKLETLLYNIVPGYHVAGKAVTVHDAAVWLQQNEPPDLVIAAVELDDGLIFSTLQEFLLPVIYIAADAALAITAFKTDCIDYLLRPVEPEALRQAIRKFERIFAPLLRETSRSYRERFIVSVGQQMKIVFAEDIAYFYTEHKVVYLVTFDGTKYTTEFTLNRLEQLLDPARFFRINRQFIINILPIVKMRAASKSRLELTLRPETKHDSVTSFERTPLFRKWLVGS